MDSPIRSNPSKRLGVKMCGNCNPWIRSMYVAEGIASGLGMELVPYEQGDVRLTISACSAACVEKSHPADLVIRAMEVCGITYKTEDELIGAAVHILGSSVLI